MNRLRLMTRSALVGLIHDKTMRAPSVAYDNGEATTLMSTDADSLDGVAEMVHEIWAQIIEVLIGTSIHLLYLLDWVLKFVPLQKNWNNATQSRIAATSSVLSAMKVIKMLGIQRNLMSHIQELRKRELWAASRLRWIVVYYNASANALGIFTPAITLIVYALISLARGGNLDTETAFTTIAILSMVTHPANMVMTIVPRAVAAFAGLERIQTFLLKQPLQDNRGILPERFEHPSPVIQIHELSIEHKQLVLDNINFEIAAGSLNIISGHTGSGKSTLLRAILGEVVPTHGSVSLSTREIAYCAQRPWLPNGTIKEAVYGATEFHDASDQYHEWWYNEVIEACRLTHDFDYLPDGDQTQIGSRGINLSGGQRQRVTLARALFARCDILLLDDIFSGLDGETEQTVFNNLLSSRGLLRRMNTTVVLVSNSLQHLQTADHIVVLNNHGILAQGNWHKIQTEAVYPAKFSSGHRVKDSAILSGNFEKLNAQLRAKDETEVDLARQTGDPAVYGYYFGFINSVNILFLLVSTASYSFFVTLPQYWLQLWTELGGRNSSYYIGGFLLLSFMSWSSTSIQMWSILIRLAPQSGLRIHQRLLRIVMSAPLSYFSKTDTGSILNRFSQDVQFVDKQLPSALQTVVTLCVVLVYIIQKAYLRTSRQLRFLELESRAGVFSSFLESVEGLETIRSFGWSRSVIQGNILSVDNSQRPEFLLLCLQRWLNIVLDLLAAAIATCVVAIAVAFRGRVSGAQVGIALNIMLVANTTLLKFVENWTTLETSLGAVARLKTLEEITPCEGAKTENLDPPENWPPKGHIEFTNITASYHSESVALRNLSLDIPAGQKLIVCGRTGSTLLLTLLRLLELQSGHIELDGIDIKQVRLDLLRQRCFVVVSQDPLILPNETLRWNLDPDTSVPNDILVASLAKAGLWAHFFDSDRGRDVEININASGFDAHPILDRKVSLFQELSVGQCQLFALCRALVKVNALRRSGVKPVIILDEVTSSLDTATESTIHQIIDDEFTEKGHTVIIVTHRLGALEEHAETGRDIVALIANGRVQEVIEDLGPATFQRFGQAG
ncbi:hypothetical protein UA08_04651 [Talaromyces atroroseus]|uniref:Uncharacterized protein n=1 Tax=Talaromyces atroroseus TaxID=1441469 RepID=A0A225AF40_TALAT|nr:hypothetical protein UA08_04651 [Talaromyces atroroseus]OKL59922.1 hypothetical protein UA08_04651 [Talaromyces atroroseus]